MVKMLEIMQNSA